MKHKVLVLLNAVCFLMLSYTAVFATSQLTPTQIQNIAKQAYIYGYPLVIMQTTERVSTNVTKPNTLGMAPVNQLSHARAFPDPSFKAVIRPNLDTLYSIAWLDLAKEPMVISVPDMHGRYYLLPMMDAWTNVFSDIGTRTTGTKAQNFVIVGPNWQGKLPRGLTVIKAPTDMVWIIGRIFTKGEADYAAVHKIQDQCRLVPLSQWGNTSYQAPQHQVDSAIDMKTAPVIQVDKMDAVTFFKTMAQAMQTNSPLPQDGPMLAKIAKIGLVPGKDFNVTKFNKAQIKALNKGLKAGLQQMNLYQDQKNVAVKSNGWNYMVKNIGAYGTNYLARAHIAWVGLGANLPEDAVYPMTTVTATGAPLTASNKYILHFNKNELPPVKAFWSLTLYNSKGFLAANPINRYILRDSDPLKYNADGSLDIYIQATSPGKDKAANWLPTPKQGDFNFALRLYWPKQSVLNGNWQVPPIKKVR